MKLSIFCVVLICLTLASAFPGEKKFTTKYDNINLQDILNNERLFNNYYKCLMELGPCTPDGTELKKSVPDALANDCDKCSEKQKAGSKTVLKFLIEKKRKQFDALEKKYDPRGVYFARYQQQAAKEGVKI